MTINNRKHGALDRQGRSPWKNKLRQGFHPFGGRTLMMTNRIVQLLNDTHKRAPIEDVAKLPIVVCKVLRILS